MNRREFATSAAALVVAGAVFPTELAKGDVSKEKPKEKSKIPETVLFYHLESRLLDVPMATASQSEVDEYYRQIDMAGAISPDLPSPEPTVPYKKWFGPAKDLVLVFEERSIRRQWARMLLYLAAGYPIATQFSMVPYYLPAGTSDIPLFVFRSEIDEKPLRCGTMTSGHQCGSILGHLYSFAGHDLRYGGTLE